MLTENCFCVHCHSTPAHNPYWCQLDLLFIWTKWPLQHYPVFMSTLTEHSVRDIMMNYYTIWMSLVTGLFCLVLLLNQLWSPLLRLQVSHCSTFRIMCDVPSIAVFCSESIECFPGTYYYYYYYCCYCYWPCSSPLRLCETSAQLDISLYVKTKMTVCWTRLCCHLHSCDFPSCFVSLISR